MSAKPVGFIGLGMMGLPMCRSLLRGGASLVVFDSLESAVETLAKDEQVSAVNSPAELCGKCDIIVMMLPNSDIVSAVVEGENGLMKALKPGNLVIDMGSSIPAETRRLAALVEKTGAGYIDAPVSGSVTKAVSGTLTLMVGGSDAQFQMGEPVLKLIGTNLIRCGPPGSGHAMKALNNFVYAAGLMAVSEALHMGEALGLDLSILADVLNSSSGKNVATETKVKQEILSGRYAGGFQLGLMRKDLETAGSIAEDTQFDGKLLELLRSEWKGGVDMLGGKVDNCEIHKFVGERKKVKKD
jgi:3-hydroxyisobutyrate dehydrogenase